MSVDETNRILARMSSGEPFRFADLWREEPKESYRLADRLIQQWRKRGWIEMRREGRDVWWSLTEAGRTALWEKSTGDVL